MPYGCGWRGLYPQQTAQDGRGLAGDVLEYLVQSIVSDPDAVEVEVDEHGNWTAGGDDAEREAAWAEYYGDGEGEGGEAPAAEASADESAEEPAADEG